MGEMSIFERLGEVESLLVAYSPRAPVTVTNDDEVVKAVQSHCANFSIIELKDLQYSRKWETPTNYDGKLDFDLKEAQKRTNSRLESIYQSLPQHTLFILVSQLSDPTTMQQLRKIRGNFQRLEREGGLVSQLPKEELWDIDKSDQLVAETAKAREALTFVKIKM